MEKRTNFKNFLILKCPSVTPSYAPNLWVSRKFLDDWSVLGIEVSMGIPHNFAALLQPDLADDPLGMTIMYVQLHVLKA